MLIAAGCATSHERRSCEDLGGRCQTPDLPCEVGTTYAGLDRCGDVPNDACCVPEPPDAGATARDAGTAAAEDAAARDGGAPLVDAGAPLGDAGAAGLFCLQHADCAGDLYCVDAYEGRVCSALCSAADTACPGALVCHVPGDLSGYCVAPCGADAGSECPAGFECEREGCVPARCALAPPTGSPGCCFFHDDCGDRERCYEVSCVEGMPGRCLPLPRPGEECWYDSDCAGVYQGEPMRCEGASPVRLDCTVPVSHFGDMGTCVPL